METLHTPGPWHWQYHPIENGIVALASATNDVLLSTGNGDHSWGEVSEANAKIIAAAPDLLSALTATVAAMEHAKKLLRVAGLTMEGGTISDPYNDAIAQANIVISKATGQG